MPLQVSEYLHVADSRDQDNLSGFYEDLSDDEKAAIDNIAIDIWPPYIRAMLNGMIKMVKISNSSFRNKERIRNTMHFHLGGLDLFPEEIKWQGLLT